MAIFPLFFGEDWDDALDSLKSAPGALGGLSWSAIRQVRAVDLAALALVVAGWLWAAFGYGVAEDHQLLLLCIALLPTALWVLAGLVGGLIFEISGLGVRVLQYWESYVLMLMFALFGVASLRVALNPRGVGIHRGPSAPGAG